MKISGGNNITCFPNSDFVPKGCNLENKLFSHFQLKSKKRARIFIFSQYL